MRSLSLNKYLIPAILSLCVGLALWYIQRDVVSLVYEVVESNTFPYEKSEGKFFVITVQNAGSKPIQNINLEVQIQTGNVVTFRFSPEKLLTNIKQGDHVIEGLVPLLNPTEKISMTVTARNKGPISAPDVFARAIGVTATRKTEGAAYVLLFKLIFPVSVALIVLTLTSTALYNYRQSRVEASLGNITKQSSELEILVKEKDTLSEKRQQESEERQREHEKQMEQLRKIHENLQKENEEQRKQQQKQQDGFSKGKPDREQIIFAILNRSGLSHLFPKLMALGEGIMFRNTGYLLLHEFLVDQQQADKYISALEQIVGTENMAPQSKGINYYLLAKMERYRRNEERAKHFLKKCQDETPLMYDHLMAYDDYYDLESLRKALLSEKKNN